MLQCRERASLLRPTGTPAPRPPSHPNKHQTCLHLRHQCGGQGPQHGDGSARVQVGAGEQLACSGGVDWLVLVVCVLGIGAVSSSQRETAPTTLPPADYGMHL